MHIWKRSWIMGSIICLSMAGCGDGAVAPASISAASAMATDALRLPEAAAVRATSQVEFNAIEIARLALHRSHNPTALTFARQMLDEHSRNHKWLRQVTVARGLKVATTLDTPGQTMWSALFVQSGKPFDRAFAAAASTLQHNGLQSIAHLEKQELQEELAAWCEAAAKTWEHEQREHDVIVANE